VWSIPPMVIGNALHENQTANSGLGLISVISLFGKGVVLHKVVRPLTSTPQRLRGA
jgi:hypothetical protein